MGGRHQNFEDPSTLGRDIRKTKFDLLGFFGATLYVSNIAHVSEELSSVSHLSCLFIFSPWYRATGTVV